MQCGVEGGGGAMEAVYVGGGCKRAVEYIRGMVWCKEVACEDVGGV